jgi:hypothetical protein
VGTSAFENGTLVGTINLRFEVHVEPGKCGYLQSLYTVTAEYKNHAGFVVGSHNYPANGIPRMCNNGWYRFDPGYANSPADAWAITDATISEDELLNTKRGTVIITVTSSHGCSAVFSAELAFMGGLGGRVITIHADDPLSIAGGYAGILYEDDEWDGTPSLEINFVWSGVQWEVMPGENPVLSEWVSGPYGMGGQHTLAGRTVTGDGDVSQGASVTVNGSASDQFGVSSASSSGGVCQ